MPRKKKAQPKEHTRSQKDQCSPGPRNKPLHIPLDFEQVVDALLKTKPPKKPPKK